MLRDHGNHSSGAATPADPPLIPEAEVADRLHRWRSELHQFVSQTRLKLDTVTQTITQRSAANAPSIEEPKDGPVVPAPPTPQLPLDRLATGVAAAAETVEVAQQNTTSVLAASTAEPAAALDVDDRLNAIKLRLAKQLQTL